MKEKDSCTSVITTLACSAPLVQPSDKFETVYISTEPLVIDGFGSQNIKWLLDAGWPLDVM